jgi:hypothetical protein
MTNHISMHLRFEIRILYEEGNLHDHIEDLHDDEYEVNSLVNDMISRDHI